MNEVYKSIKTDKFNYLFLKYTSFSLFQFLAPSVLTEFLLNDNNTAVYSVYARNILEYPFSKTYLLMSEIGPDGQNIFNYNNNENQIQRYINHPLYLYG